MHEDNEFMEKVKKGDKAAYETLVIKHRAAAVSFATGIVSDFYIAEDIVQECFAKVYINRMSYKPSNAFKTYLFTVIRNSCIDYLRETKRRIELSNNVSINISIDSFQQLSNGKRVEDLLFEKDKMRELFNNLNKLPGDYRTALHLFAFDEMSYANIAKVMRKSIPQVKIIIFRARKKLKKLCNGVDCDEK